MEDSLHFGNPAWRARCVEGVMHWTQVPSVFPASRLAELVIKQLLPLLFRWLWRLQLSGEQTAKHPCPQRRLPLSACLPWQTMKVGASM